MVALQDYDYFDIEINAEKIQEEKLTFICARERQRSHARDFIMRISCTCTHVRYYTISRNQERRIET